MLLFCFDEGMHQTLLESEEEIRLDEALRISPDSDNDGIANLVDNCPLVANEDQVDTNACPSQKTRQYRMSNRVILLRRS